MSIKCGEIVDFMDEFAPAYLAENWDNVGLLVGNKENTVKRVMVCLDVTKQVLDEAIFKKADMIISHHPIIFKSLKSISGNDAKTKILVDLIKSNLNVYSAHTNLDVTEGGVNDCLANAVGLHNTKELNSYKSDCLYKLVVFIPRESLQVVREAVCKAGAGFIGKYSDCTFFTEGTGTFTPLKGTKPYIGTQDRLVKTQEYRMETIVPQKLLNKVLSNMIKAHPYEEVAYDIYPLDMKGRKYGLGRAGILVEPLQFNEFVKKIKKRLNIKALRVIGDINKMVSRVGVFCGSFDGDWSGVERENLDVLITGEIKHHMALEAVQLGRCVLEAGHFETEAVVIPEIVRKISDRFPDIEVARSIKEENPLKTI